jgi:L-iditol 2-dehydrogenase
MIFMGQPGQHTGLLSEFVVMPSHCCFPLPDHLDNETAVIAEPLSIAIWASDLANVQKGMKIGILGSGPIGMCVLLYCRYLGCMDIYITDKLDYRLEMASEAGAGWTGNADASDIVSGILGEEPEGLDIVFDCCGMQEAMDQAVELMKPGGHISIIGIPEFDTWHLPTDLIRRKEICIQNVRRQNNRLKTAIDLIAENKIDVSPLITHRFPLEETGQAFDLVSKYGDGVMKTIIEI